MITEKDIQDIQTAAENCAFWADQDELGYYDRMQLRKREHQLRERAAELVVELMQQESIAESPANSMLILGCRVIGVMTILVLVCWGFWRIFL